MPSAEGSQRPRVGTRGRGGRTAPRVATRTHPAAFPQSPGAEIRALAGRVRDFGRLRLPFGDPCFERREMGEQWTHFLAPPVPGALESSEGGGLALQLTVFPGKRPGETERSDVFMSFVCLFVSLFFFAARILKRSWLTLPENSSSCYLGQTKANCLHLVKNKVDFFSLPEQTNLFLGGRVAVWSTLVSPAL